jgi:hypothetical protein
LDNQKKRKRQGWKILKKALVVKVHEPNTRFSLALEGLKLVEVKFCEREKKGNNHYFEASKV